MRSFTCQVCGNLLTFENSVCLRCSTDQGFSVARLQLVPVAGRRVCANLGAVGCHWLVEADGAAGGDLCLACRLTRTRPPATDLGSMASWARTETAKKRLVYQLLDLGLPVLPQAQDARGLAFDLLSSAAQPVTTGHADGVVTIDLAEGEDAHREAVRQKMGEPYRTLLGHLRHEVGHYYWQVLVEGNGLIASAGGARLREFRSVFGDERVDYGQALQRHYGSGAPAGWQDTHVSAYATAHPWEDWAESFAHYLHILDTIQTASAYGMVVTGPQVAAPEQARDLVALPTDAQAQADSIEQVVATWLPLTYALNAVNRSMGQDDLYPFVLSAAVVAKLGLVHRAVRAASAASA